MQNLDDVVASNVNRIREAAGVSRPVLAARLGVGQHVVRDYERPRKGQSQRAFLWSEIVALCHALDTNLFELVLPPGDVEVELPHVSLQARAALERRFAGDPMPWRAWLSELLFGMSGDHTQKALLERLTQWRREERQRRDEIKLELWKELAAQREQEKQ